MLIFWRGLSWLVPVIVYGTFVVVQFSVNVIYGGEFCLASERYQTLATILAAVFVGALGYYLNHAMNQDLIDEDTDEVIGKLPPHSLLIYPIEYWALITLMSGPLINLEWP